MIVHSWLDGYIRWNHRTVDPHLWTCSFCKLVNHKKTFPIKFSQWQTSNQHLLVSKAELSSWPCRKSKINELLNKDAMYEHTRCTFTKLELNTNSNGQHYESLWILCKSIASCNLSASSRSHHWYRNLSTMSRNHGDRTIPPSFRSALATRFFSCSLLTYWTAATCTL